MIPPIPAGLCGNRGCVFTAKHLGPCSWVLPSPLIGGPR